MQTKIDFLPVETLAYLNILLFKNGMCDFVNKLFLLLLTFIQ